MNFLKKNLIYIIILGLGIIVLIWAGLKFFKASNNQDSTSSNNTNETDSFGSRGQFGGRPGLGQGNFQPISGTITDIKGEVIVAKTDEGSTKNIICSSATRIMKQENSERITLNCSDLEKGDKIHVMSEDSEADTIQAQMIFIGEFQPPERSDASPDNNSENDGLISNDSVTSQEI